MTPTTSSSKGRQLASNINSKVDQELAEFDRLVERAKRQMDGGDGDQLLISENTDGISGIEEYFSEITLSMMLWSAAELASIYGVAIPAKLSETKVKSVLGSLNARYNGMVTEAKFITKVTSSFEDGATADLLITPRNINSLRKSVDFAATFSAEHGVYLAGNETFDKKTVVIVRDSETTDLCRNRMAGQVVPWKGYYVDPVSGSRWLHPPFIFAKLSKAELLHACRSSSVPSD